MSKKTYQIEVTKKEFYFLCRNIKDFTKSQIKIYGKKNCEYCMIEFEQKTKIQRFCSRQCSRLNLCK